MEWNAVRPIFTDTCSEGVRDGPCDSRIAFVRSPPFHIPTSHFPLQRTQYPTKQTKPLGTHPKPHPLTYPSVPFLPSLPFVPHPQPHSSIKQVSSPTTNTKNNQHRHSSRQLSEPPRPPTPIPHTTPEKSLPPILKHRPSPTPTTTEPPPIPRTGSDRAEMSVPLWARAGGR